MGKDLKVRWGRYTDITVDTLFISYTHTYIHTYTRTYIRTCVLKYIPYIIYVLKYTDKHAYTGPAIGGAGPNWEQFQSAQVPSQLAPRSVLVCT